MHIKPQHHYPNFPVGSAEDRLAALAEKAIRAAREWAERAEAACVAHEVPAAALDQLAAHIELCESGFLFGGAFAESAIELAQTLEDAGGSRHCQSTKGEEGAMPTLWAELRTTAAAAHAAADLAAAIAYRNGSVVRLS